MGRACSTRGIRGIHYFKTYLYPGLDISRGSSCGFSKKELLACLMSHVHVHNHRVRPQI
jgi:hypothetical protein